MEDSKLPDEMIMEIMSWAQLKTLDTLRCTSRYFNTLANESLVLDSNTERNNMVSGFLIQNPRRTYLYVNEFAPSPKSKSLDVSFLQDNARILATSEQGMMVYMTIDPTNNRRYSYYVCKPATKQILALPCPKGNHTVEKVAIVVMGSKPLHYKIIRFSQHNIYCSICCSCLRRWRKFYSWYGCDIFDSLMGKWRSLEHIKLADLVHFTNSQLITVSGSIYMLLSNNDVLKFNAYTEKWKVFPSPIPYDESKFLNPPIELVKCGVRLGLAYKPIRANGVWEIWVHTLDERREKQDVAVETKSEFESLKALHGPDTSVTVKDRTLVFYKYKEHGNNMMSKVVLNDSPYRIFSFRSDFEPLDLVRPEGNQS
ncbi:uncharacterized protein LOC143630214 [Bidens hawaiensis]|uniref:uncharacterized protein LOC143630214 n=1 Tax=Bidens hawaiensis TaxID=980011 RepID=UPI00404A6EBA